MAWGQWASKVVTIHDYAPPPNFHCATEMPWPRSKKRMQSKTMRATYFKLGHITSHFIQADDRVLRSKVPANEQSRVTDQGDSATLILLVAAGDYSIARNFLGDVNITTGAEGGCMVVGVAVLNVSSTCGLAM